MERKSKIKLLNKLLAAASQCGNEDFFNAASGISKAVESESGKASLEDFAKKILSLYNPEARVEVLEFGGGHFDPLFAAPLISLALKRLSGYDNAILVVSGLHDSTASAKGRAAKKKKIEYSQNLEFVEGSVLRHSDSLPNLEIFYI